jgi:hypothetical protein
MNIIGVGSRFTDTDDYKKYSIEKAIKRADITSLGLILQSDLSAGVKTFSIITAAQFGSMDVMKCILSAGFEISDATRGGAVAYAALKGDLDMVQYLLPATRKIDNPLKFAAISNAVDAKHLGILKYLLKEDRSIPKDFLEQLIAGAKGHRDICNYLLRL